MVRARRWQVQVAAACLAWHAGGAFGAVFEVTEPWVRPAAAAATTQAYMQLASSDGATLVDVRSGVAARVRLVTARKAQDPPFALVLPPRTTVALEPAGTWLVLHQITRPLKIGDRVPLTLTLRHADGATQEIEVEAEVRRRSARDDHRVPHKH